MAPKPIDETNITYFTALPNAGIIYAAPYGTALPTKFVKPSELDAAFESLGDLGEDGFTESTESDTNDFSDVRGHVVLTVSNGKTRKYQLNLIEANRPAVLKFFYGNVEVGTDGKPTHVELTEDENPESSLVIYELMTNGRVDMTVIERCKPTDFDDVAHNRSNLRSLSTTVTCYGTDGKVGDKWFADEADATDTTAGA